jgi:hypothetical protein
MIDSRTCNRLVCGTGFVVGLVVIPGLITQLVGRPNLYIEFLSLGDHITFSQRLHCFFWFLFPVIPAEMGM